MSTTTTDPKGLDTRRRCATPPVLPSLYSAAGRARRLAEVPLEVWIPLGGVALVALSFNLLATLLVGVLTVCLILVQRSLFHPELALTDYVEALAEDLEAVVQRVKRKNVATIVAVAAACLLVPLAPHVVGGLVGAAAALLLLLHTGVLPKLVSRRAAEPSQPCRGIAPLRKLLQQPLLCVAVSSLSAVPVLYCLVSMPGLPWREALAESSIARWAVVLLPTAAGAFWASMGGRVVPQNGEGTRVGSRSAARVPLFAHIIFSLGVGCTGVWLAHHHEVSYPFRQPTWNGLLAASLVAAVYWAGVLLATRTEAEQSVPDKSRALSAWGTAVFVAAGLLAWPALILEQEHESGWQSMAAWGVVLLVWYLSAERLVLETRDWESGRVPSWTVMQLAMMACLLVMFVCDRLDGGRGLVLSLVAIGFIADNARRTCVVRPEKED